MNSEISKNLIEQGYAVIENCLDKKLIDDINQIDNQELSSTEKDEDDESVIPDL